MIYGSVCSGIGSAEMAWAGLGWRPAFVAEIDAFPAAVLGARIGATRPRHMPDPDAHGLDDAERQARRLAIRRLRNAPRWGNAVVNYGDFTRIREDADHEPIDLLVGGTPCQSFSVAGLRKGLDDDRGNLALEFCRLVAHARPRWVLWENVPGVLSSSGGRDFGAILGALVELGYGLAWRILDAQYVRVDSHARAVPQRRQRVFLVGHSGAAWQRAAAVLFELESLRGDPPPRREAGQDPAAAAGVGAGMGGGVPDVSPALKARDFKGPSSDGDGDGAPLIAHTLRASGFDGSEDGTGRGVPLVAFSSKDAGLDASEDVSPTLRAMGHAGNHPNAGGQVAVAFQPRFARNDRGGPDTVAAPLTAHAGGTGKGDSAQCVAYPEDADGYAVRRLTPRECERLQGLPDDHTLIEWGGKPAEKCPDGPRYKACGNSMANNAMRWLGRRIEFVDALPMEAAS